MNASLRLGVIRGIPIELHLSWVLIFGLLTFTLAGGLFPSAYPGLAPPQYWAMGVVGALLFFASVLLHELGHSFTAMGHGIPIRRITLFIFGGVAQIGSEPNSPRVEFQVAIAGPLVSLALAGVFWVLAQAFHALGWGAPLAVAGYLSRVNLLLAAFNMVPAFPLDGGRVLRAALWRWSGSLQRATGIAATIGQAFAFMLMFVGAVGIIGGEVVQGLWFAFIGWFLQQASQASYAQVALRNSLAGIPVRHLMSTQVRTVPAEISVQQLVNDYFYRYRFAAFPVMAGGRLAGMVSLHEVRSLEPEKWLHATVADVARPLSGEDFVDADMDAADALMHMASHNLGRLLVMENGQMVGLLSRTDIFRLIRIQQELRV